MPLYAVKTTKSQERTVAKMLANREVEGIHSALATDEMPSYVMVESDNQEIIERALGEIPHAQKVVQGQASMAEIQHFLEPSSDVENVTENDVVEITDGPYQGEKAKVKSIQEGKEQVTVELVDATVPIPVTIRGDQVRRLDSDDR